MSYGPLSLRAHALIDALLVVIGLAGPFVLGYAGHTPATLYTFALVAFGLGLNLVTDYPLGLFRRLPFKWHQLVEWTAALPFIAVPWLVFREAGAMPWFVSAIGAAITLNTALTRPRAPPAA
jgi:hypothetical protein